MRRLFIILGLIATSASAQVQLNVQPNIKVLAINGQSINRNPFAPVQQHFDLPAGETSISARYERLFDLRGRAHDYLRSQEITLTADLADNQHYHLTLSDDPDHYDSAKRYAKQPTLILSQQGQVIAKQSADGNRQGQLLTNINALFNADKTQTAKPSDHFQAFIELWQTADETERQKIRQWLK